MPWLDPFNIYPYNNHLLIIRRWSSLTGNWILAGDSAGFEQDGEEELASIIMYLRYARSLWAVPGAYL